MYDLYIEINKKIKFHRFCHPTERTIRNVVKHFEETGSVEDRVRLVHYCGAHSVKNIENFLQLPSAHFAYRLALVLA